MPKIANFETAVSLYRERLHSALYPNFANQTDSNLVASSKAQTKSIGHIDSEWLRHLHSEHHERLLHDNNRIWNGAQLLIPAALVPFGALATIQTLPSHGTLSIFALISISLILFWHFMAEGHKAFQQKSLAWMVAIEEELGLFTRDLPSRVFSTEISRSFVVQENDILPLVRQILVLLFLIAWLGLLLLFPTK